MKSLLAVVFLAIGMNGQTVQGCNPKDATPCEVQKAEKLSRIDVPAVQEKYLAHKKGLSCNFPPVDGLLDPAIDCRWTQDDYELRWTCADTARALETSVDGLRHWCHRMQP